MRAFTRAGSRAHVAAERAKVAAMNCRASSLLVATPLLLAFACGEAGRETLGATEGATPGTGVGPATATPTTTSGHGSASDSETGTTLAPTSTSSATSTSTTTGESAGTTTMGLKFDLEPQPDVGEACGQGGGGDVEFSYIWVANSSQGTISKINTQTMIEEGRYIVRPDSAGNPSRTSVNLAGDVAVANRSGGIAKVLARVEDCVESNGTPGIQTSTGAGDILPWGVEECVAWYTPFAFNTQRPLAWSPGQFNKATCAYEDMQVWTTGGQAGAVTGYAATGLTGAIEVELPIPELQIGSFGPYGAAFDPAGDFWFVDSGNDGAVQELVRVDTAMNTYEIWTTPAIHPYGFTVDTVGRPWIAGYQGGIARFDPVTQTFETNPGHNGLGIQEDAEGRMWIAKYPWTQPEMIYALDRDSMQLIKEIVLPSSLVKGISIDFYGKVWAVDQGSSAFRVDPDVDTFDVYSGLTGPYTYSDMTGWGLSSVTVPQG